MGIKITDDSNIKRPTTPAQSLKKSLEEVKLHRQGKIKLKTWDELKKELSND